MLLSALEFISYDCFINPSRAPLSLVKKKDDRLVMSDRPDNTAVLLITGLAVDSNLIEPYKHTYMGNTTRVKRLLLWPFSQEFELAISYIGNAWGVEHVSIPINGGIFKFSTRKDTAQSNNSGGTSCNSFDYL